MKALHLHKASSSSTSRPEPSFYKNERSCQWFCSDVFQSFLLNNKYNFYFFSLFPRHVHTHTHEESICGIKCFAPLIVALLAFYELSSCCFWLFANQKQHHFFSFSNFQSALIFIFLPLLWFACNSSSTAPCPPSCREGSASSRGGRHTGENFSIHFRNGRLFYFLIFAPFINWFPGSLCVFFFLFFTLPWWKNWQWLHVGFDIQEPPLEGFDWLRRRVAMVKAVIKAIKAAGIGLNGSSYCMRCHKLNRKEDVKQGGMGKTWKVR